MINLLKMLIVVGLTFFILSCSVSIDDYQKSDQPFDIQSYFQGNVIAWGIIQNYEDQVLRRFCVEITGSWQENNGVLAEKFYFDDGEISYRNWQLTKLADGTYQGTAEDVKGIAIGIHQGFAFQFQYTLLLNLNDESYEMTMDDWMYQLDPYRVINKTEMTKFGIKVADITLFFNKALPDKTCSNTTFR